MSLPFINQALAHLVVDSPHQYDIYARENLDRSYDGMVSFLDEANRRIGRRLITFHTIESVERVIFTYRSGQTTSLPLNEPPNLRLAYLREFGLGELCNLEHGYHLEVVHHAAVETIFVRLVRTGIRQGRKIVFREAFDMEPQWVHHFCYIQIHDTFTQHLQKFLDSEYEHRERVQWLGGNETVLDTIEEEEEEG